MNKKIYFLHPGNMLLFIFIVAFFLIGIVILIYTSFDDIKTIKDIFFVICSFIGLFLFIIGLSYRIQINDSYFTLKYINFKVLKIDYKDVLYVNIFVLYWKHYTIGYMKNGKQVNTVLLSLWNIHDFFNVLQKHNPEVRIEEKIKLKIDKLKRAGKIH